MAGSSRIALDNGEAERPPQSTPEVVERPVTEPPTTPPPEPKTPPAETAGPSTSTPDLDPVVKERIDGLTRRYYEAKRLADENAGRAQSLERELQRRQQPVSQVPPYGAPVGQPDQAAEERAYQRVKNEQTQDQFNKACNDLYAKGREAYGEGMDEAVRSLNAVGWGNRPDALAALTQLPEGHKVYRELASDLDNAARVLNLPPMAMMRELTIMSLNGSGPSNSETPVPPRTQVSRAPEPLRPVGGRSAPAPKQLKDMSIADFIRTRDQQEGGASRRIRR